jgi:hypothetical protein
MRDGGCLADTPRVWKGGFAAESDASNECSTYCSDYEQLKDDDYWSGLITSQGFEPVDLENCKVPELVKLSSNNLGYIIGIVGLAAIFALICIKKK